MTNSQPTADTLHDLIQSTLAFYARFDVWPERETALRVFREEVGELIEAAQNGADRAHIAEEAADVFVTAIGVCLALGVEPDQILAQTRAVIAKNDAKNHETHYINDQGKIARRATRQEE